MKNKKFDDKPVKLFFRKREVSNEPLPLWTLTSRNGNRDSNTSETTQTFNFMV